MNWLNPGWLWLYAGAVLMLMEIIVPGFVMFFFGLAAATVGFTRFALGEALSPAWQLAAFSALSVIYITMLRRIVKSVFAGGRSDSPEGLGDEYVGRAGKVTGAINPPLAGRVELGDAQWAAVADEPIAAGVDVLVVSRSNLTMKVKEIKS